MAQLGPLARKLRAPHWLQLNYMPGCGRRSFLKRGRLLLDKGERGSGRYKSIDVHCGLLICEVGIMILTCLDSLERIIDALKTTKSTPSVLIPY